MTIGNFSVCDIYYTGIGSNFRTHFCEIEFREIIKTYLLCFNLHILSKNKVSYFKPVIENPLHCSLDLLLEFTGAYKV